MSKNINDTELLKHLVESKINFISYKHISQSIDIVLNKELTGIYNIGSNKSTSLKEILFHVKKVSKIDKSVDYQITYSYK